MLWSLESPGVLIHVKILIEQTALPSRKGKRCWFVRIYSGLIFCVNLHSERCILAVSPLSHRAIIVACALIAEQLQDKHSVRRTDTALSISYDFLVWSCPNFFQHCPEFIGGLYGLMAIVSDEF